MTSSETSREEFEVWYSDHREMHETMLHWRGQIFDDRSRLKPDTPYERADVQSAWEVWQASRQPTPQEAAGEMYQPIETAPRDGTWVLLRGRNAARVPMIPVVVAWRRGEGSAQAVTWRDSASLRDMSRLISDVPHGHAADWAALSTRSSGDEK